ncbi:MAG: type 1 glutamine amidotransferase domain-containing protein [Kovacikia sp.]
MSQELNHKKVAILVADGFEQVELTGPKQALEEAGAQTHIISPNSDTVQGWNHFDKGDEFPVDVALNEANPGDYDALLLPGGVANPDQLRTQADAVRFIKSFFEAEKPVAAICHGPWTLIEAGVVRDRTMTSWPSLQTDLKNAGATWVDQEVVVDQGLVTSRNPQDIPAFNRKIVEEFAEGKYQNRQLSATR